MMNLNLCKLDVALLQQPYGGCKFVWTVISKYTVNLIIFAKYWYWFSCDNYDCLSDEMKAKKSNFKEN